MNARALLAIAALACGCGRTFTAPPPRVQAPLAPQPPRLLGAQPAAAFAGETVTLSGENLGSDPLQLAVHLGAHAAQVLALRAGSPAQLDVRVPELGEGPQHAALTVGVGGQVGALDGGFDYRGVGHLKGLAVDTVTDLSPRPTAAITHAAGGLALGEGRNVAYRLFTSSGRNAWRPPDGISIFYGDYAGPNDAYLAGIYDQNVIQIARMGPAPDGGGNALTTWDIHLGFQGRYFTTQSGLVYFGPDQPEVDAVWLHTPATWAGTADPSAVPGVDRIAFVDPAPPATIHWMDMRQGQIIDGGSFAAPLLDQGYALTSNLDLTADLNDFILDAVAADGTHALLRIGMDGGASNESVIQSELTAVNLFAVAQNCIAVDHQNPFGVLLYSIDGTGPCNGFLEPTPGEVTMVTRDMGSANRLLILVTSPPEYFYFDVVANVAYPPRAVNAFITNVRVNPSETRAAVTTRDPPSVAVLAMPDLQAGDSAVFQSPAAVGGAKETYAWDLAWAGDDTLCALLSHPPDGGAYGMGCGPADDLFGAGYCAVQPPGANWSLSTRLIGTRGSEVVVINGASAFSCDTRQCPVLCAPLWFSGQFAQDWTYFDASEDLRTVVFSSSAFSERPKITTLREGDAPTTTQLDIPFLSGLLIDPEARLTVALGSGNVASVIDVASGKVVADLDLEGDGANTAALSPDGDRLYVGTQDDALYEFDIAAIRALGPPAAAPPIVEPIRSALLSGYVSGISPSPGGGAAYLFADGAAQDLIYRAH